MSSIDKIPAPAPAAGSPAATVDSPTPPGNPETITTKVIDTSAKAIQPLKPINQIKQHATTFALYSHDLSRQIETHHFLSRLNRDFIQCPVYDSSDPSARLIGVEYIISEALFETLPPDEQRLWHSHAYEVKTGLWTCPRVPEVVARKEVAEIARTYGKFWCTWEVDRGDRVPMGAPVLMVSPQGVKGGKVKEEMVKRRDDELGISREELSAGRVETAEPECIHPNADWWRQHGKGFVVDLVDTEQ